MFSVTPGPFRVDTIPSVARWNLSSLNYRRGMQRIYLFLSVLWIAAIAGVSISERPVPVLQATKTQFGDPIDRPSGGTRVDENGNPIPPQKPIYLDDKGNPIPASTPADPWEAAAIEGREEQIHLAANYNQERVSYWKWRGVTAFAPPVTGYVVFFGILPWIGRGFRSTQA